MVWPHRVRKYAVPSCCNTTITTTASSDPGPSLRTLSDTARVRLLLVLQMVFLLVANNPRLDPQQGPYDAEDGADAGENGDAVARYEARAERFAVEEVVRVEVRDGVGEVGEAEIEEEEENEER